MHVHLANNLIMSSSSHSWHFVLRLRYRLSCRSNTNICKSLVKEKSVRDIQYCVVIVFFPQIHLRSWTELDDDKSALCRGQCLIMPKKAVEQEGLTHNWSIIYNYCNPFYVLPTIYSCYNCGVMTFSTTPMLIFCAIKYHQCRGNQNSIVLNIISTITDA